MQDFEYLKNKNILVTGGTGDIGSVLVEFLCNLSDVTIHVLARKTSSFEKISHILDGVKIIYGDILVYKSLESPIIKIKPDVIFHLGSQSDVFTGIKFPLQEFDTNVRGTLFILKLARKVDAKVVFASSATVYGEPSRIPVKEEDPTNPISTQGTSKICCEKYLEIFNKIYGLDSIVLRYFNVYGPSFNKRIVYDIFSKLQKNKNEIKIFGTGEEVRDYVFSHDVVEATILSSKLNDFHLLNVGTGVGTKIVDLIALMAKELKINPTILMEKSTKKGDIQKLVADTSKIYKLLGWKARTSLEDGIKKTIGHYLIG